DDPGVVEVHLGDGDGCLPRTKLGLELGFTSSEHRELLPLAVELCPAAVERCSESIVIGNGVFQVLRRRRTTSDHLLFANSVLSRSFHVRRGCPQVSNGLGNASLLKLLLRSELLE